jgi:hypothetical protein
MRIRWLGVELGKVLNFKTFSLPLSKGPDAGHDLVLEIRKPVVVYEGHFTTG